MTSVKVKEVQKEEASELAKWLASDHWPTFIGDYSSESELLDKIKSGAYIGLGDEPEERSFWIINAHHEKVGLIELYELSELAPSFSIRIQSARRKKGYGRGGLNWLCGYFFESYPSKRRLEAQTREDNIGMRKLLEEFHFVLEGYYRFAWPTDNGDPLASVAYGLLREDWKNQKQSAIQWDRVGYQY